MKKHQNEAVNKNIKKINITIAFFKTVVYQPKVTIWKFIYK